MQHRQGHHALPCGRAFVVRFACFDGRNAYNQRTPSVNLQSSTNVIAAVHRFEESIAGRLYLIEVKAVSKDRWSACIVRVPRLPTALMPFYGRTPVEAAQQLSEWLTRAHARGADSTDTV